MNNTNWKIAEQSKQKMATALLSIMKQNAYKEITVIQITQEALLSRQIYPIQLRGEIILLEFKG